MKDALADAETLRLACVDGYTIRNPRRHLVGRISPFLPSTLFFPGWERFRQAENDYADIYTPVRAAARAAFRAVPGLKGK